MTPLDTGLRQPRLPEDAIERVELGGRDQPTPHSLVDSSKIQSLMNMSESFR